MKYQTPLKPSSFSFTTLILLFLFAGCAERPRKDFNLTIVVTDRLGRANADKIPPDIINLCLPIEDCEQSTLVPRPILYRLGLIKPKEKSLETTISGGLAGNKDNPRFIARSIKANLSNTEIGEDFSHETDPSVNLNAALDSYLNSVRKHSSVIAFAGRGGGEYLIEGIKVLATIDSIRAHIAKDICEGKAASFVVLFNPPNIQVPDTGGNDEHGPSPESKKSAEKDFQQYLQWRNSGLHSLEEIIKRLELLENNYSWDYRFTLELSRETIFGYKDHPKAFELLRIAAEKAIKNWQANEMLEDLDKEKHDKVKGFWKMATHPKEWNHIIESLEKRDPSTLYQPHDEQIKH